MIRGHTTQYMLVLRAFPERWASDFSEEVLLTAAVDTVAPNAPSNVTVEAITEGLVVSWTNPTLNSDGTTCSDLAWIRVYKSTSANIDIADPETYDARFLVNGETYTMATEALNGAARYYRCVISSPNAVDIASASDRGFRGREQKMYYTVLTSIDRTGNESIASAEVSGTPAASPAADDAYDRYMYVRILDADTDHAVDTSIGGDVLMIEAVTVVSVGAFSDTAGSGSVTTIDINENGTSILSTEITIDAAEKNSQTADVAPVITDTAIAANSILTFDIDGIASGTAGKGMTVWLKVKFS